MLLLDQSYGIIPVYRDKGTDRYLLVHHAKGHWGFPKGHAEGAETPIAAAKRELFEECSVSEIRILPEYLFHEKYTFTSEGTGLPVEKSNVFFLGLVSDMRTTPQEGEILECRFVTEAEAGGMTLFPELRQVLAEASAVLARIPE